MRKIIFRHSNAATRRIYVNRGKRKNEKTGRGIFRKTKNA